MLACELNSTFNFECQRARFVLKQLLWGSRLDVGFSDFGANIDNRKFEFPTVFEKTREKIQENCEIIAKSREVWAG
jgi:hypothetical protein